MLRPLRAVATSVPREFAASAAHTPVVTHAVDGDCLYNLRLPANTGAGDRYTIRGRPFGDGNPDTGIAVVLLIK